MSKISIRFNNDHIHVMGIQPVSATHDFKLANNNRKEGGT